MDELDFLPPGSTLLKSVLVRNAVRRSVASTSSRIDGRSVAPSASQDRWALMYARSGLGRGSAAGIEDDGDDEDEDEDEANEEYLDEDPVRVTVVSVRDYDYEEEAYLETQDWTALATAAKLLHDGQEGDYEEEYADQFSAEPLSSISSAHHSTTAHAMESPESSTASLSSNGSASQEETQWFEHVFESLSAEEQDKEQEVAAAVGVENHEEDNNDPEAALRRLPSEEVWPSSSIVWDEELPSLIHDGSDESEDSDSEDERSTSYASSPPSDSPIAMAKNVREERHHHHYTTFPSSVEQPLLL